MTTEQMEQLLDRVLNEAGFCRRLLADPQGTVGELGARLAADELATITGMTEDELRGFANEYKSATDPSKRRAAC